MVWGCCCAASGTGRNAIIDSASYQCYSDNVRPSAGKLKMVQKWTFQRHKSTLAMERNPKFNTQIYDMLWLQQFVVRSHGVMMETAGSDKTIIAAGVLMALVASN